MPPLSKWYIWTNELQLQLIYCLELAVVCGYEDAMKRLEGSLPIGHYMTFLDHMLVVGMEISKDQCKGNRICRQYSILSLSLEATRSLVIPSVKSPSQGSSSDGSSPASTSGLFLASSGFQESKQRSGSKFSRVSHCPDCSEKFIGSSQATNLQRHRRNSHELSTYRTCSFCGVTIKRSDNLLKHVRNKHQIAEPPVSTARSNKRGKEKRSQTRVDQGT